MKRQAIVFLLDLGTGRSGITTRPRPHLPGYDAALAAFEARAALLLADFRGQAAGSQLASSLDLSINMLLSSITVEFGKGFHFHSLRTQEEFDAKIIELEKYFAGPEVEEESQEVRSPLPIEAYPRPPMPPAPAPAVPQVPPPTTLPPQPSYKEVVKEAPTGVRKKREAKAFPPVLEEAPIEKPKLQRVVLCCADLDLVVSVQIPKVGGPVEAVVYGSRVFSLFGQTVWDLKKRCRAPDRALAEGKEGDFEVCRLYLEVSAFTVPDGSSEL